MDNSPAAQATANHLHAWSTRRSLTLAAVWAFVVISILPVVFHLPARSPRKSRAELATELGYGVAVFIGVWIYRVESRRLLRSQAAALVLSVFILTGVVNRIHGFDIDYAPKSAEKPTDMSNGDWQKMLQNSVIESSPVVLPHSYRFLPNGMVRWLEFENVPFELARDLYRLLSGVLLFYAIYRYARLYTTYLGGVLAMLFASLVFPVSFEWYSGQLTDPLSQLSFVLAFIFLETEDFAFLLSTLLIGALAKETVLSLAGYYVLFNRKESHFAKKASILCIASLVLYVGVRMLVLKQSMQYQQISNVHLDHFLVNVTDSRWPMPFLFTAGTYLPFLVLGWKQRPTSLRNLALFLLVVLFVSSLFFSWLSEGRNYMPAVFVLAVVTARYFTSEETSLWSRSG